MIMIFYAWYHAYKFALIEAIYFDDSLWAAVIDCSWYRRPTNTSFLASAQEN